MTDKAPPKPANTEERPGPARDFAAFSRLELERRRNSDRDFDPGVFHEAVALVLGKINGLSGSDDGSSDDDHQ